MVRPAVLAPEIRATKEKRSGSPVLEATMRAKKAHPESYAVTYPSYVRMTPTTLHSLWRRAPLGAQPVVLFYDESELVRDLFILSNWHVAPFSFPFSFPLWLRELRRDWLELVSAPMQFQVNCGEVPLMLCKAALMQDERKLREISEADSPATAKALGRRITGFQQTLWDQYVCAVMIAVVRARVEKLPELRATLQPLSGRYIAEAAQRDLTFGIGWRSTDVEAMQPREWRGANVLGWSYMCLVQELSRAPDSDSPSSNVLPLGSSSQAGPGSAAAEASAPAPPVVSLPESTVDGPVPGSLVEGVAVPEAMVARLSLMHAAFMQCAAILVFVSTLVEPLILAHTDGDSVLVTESSPELPAGRGVADRRLAKAEMAVNQIFHPCPPLIVPAGSTQEGAGVLLAPVPIHPSSTMVIRSSRQRIRSKKVGFFFMTLSAIAGTVYYDSLAPALVRANTFVRPTMSIQESILAGASLAEQVTFRFGGLPVTSLLKDTLPLRQRVLPHADSCRRLNEGTRQMRHALLDFVAEDPEVQADVREAAVGVEFIDPNLVPEALCRQGVDFNDPILDSIPFSHECPVPVTDFVPRAPAQPAQCSTCAATVSTCTELILNVPRCTGLMEEWRANATHDFEILRSGERLDGRRRTRFVALGRDCFVPCARECWFDCRRQEEGIVQALDYYQDIDSQVDRDFIRANMEGWPDQETASNLAYGALVSPAMPHMLVLCNQLLSLADGFALVQAGLMDLAAKGWYAIFAHIPFMPGHFCPKGMTTRALEKDNPRPTTDGSAPNSKAGGAPSVYDTEGRPVFSPNWRARGGADAEAPGPEVAYSDAEETACVDCSRPWAVNSEGLHVRPSHAQLNAEPPKGWESRASTQWNVEWWRGHATWGWYGSGRTPELKPTLRGLALDNSILQRPAACLQLPIFSFVKDWKNGFMHIRTRPESWPTSMTMAYSTPHLQPEAPPHIKYVSEYVLGFGHTFNSGNFQRFASYLIALVEQKMDLLERTRVAALEAQHSCLAGWLAKRRRLSSTTHRNEAKLYALRVYTDDPHGQCVGIPCMLNLLQAWASVMRAVRMIPANPLKQKLGFQIKWLGAMPNTQLSFLTVPEDKILRVQQQLVRAMAGELPLSEYRSLLGFLEWFSWVFIYSRERMFSLYRPLRAGHEVDTGPATLVHPDNRMHSQLERWRTDLWKVAGVSMRQALPRRRRAPQPSSPTFFVSMDAAKEGTDTPGLAGWCHGYTWHLFYDISWMLLPITVLEFLAFAVSLIVFAPLLMNALRVLFETDSLTTALDLVAGNAHADLMQEVYLEMLATNEWKLLMDQGDEKERLIRHSMGRINIFADAESRGKVDLVKQLCEHFGIRRVELPLPCEAVFFLNRVVERLNPLVPGVLKNLDVSPACIAHDGPNTWMDAPIFTVGAGLRHPTEEECHGNLTTAPFTALGLGCKAARADGDDDYKQFSSDNPCSGLVVVVHFCNLHTPCESQASNRPWMAGLFLQRRVLTTAPFTALGLGCKAARADGDDDYKQFSSDNPCSGLVVVVHFCNLHTPCESQASNRPWMAGLLLQRRVLGPERQGLSLRAELHVILKRDRPVSPSPPAFEGGNLGSTEPGNANLNMVGSQIAHLRLRGAGGPQSLEGFLGPPPPPPSVQHSSSATRTLEGLLGASQPATLETTSNSAPGASLVALQSGASHHSIVQQRALAAGSNQAHIGGQHQTLAGSSQEDYYRIEPPPEIQEAYDSQRAHFIEASFPAGSSHHSHWRFWDTHCARWGCRTPWRGNHDAISGRDPVAFRQEVNLVGSFVLDRYFTMEPRTKGTVPKVQSAFQSYLAVRRVLDTRSIPHLNIQEIHTMLKGLTNALIEELGEEIMLPHRKQPFTDDIQQNLLHWIPEGARLGRFTYYANSRFGRTWKGILRTQDLAGFRKAEWTLAAVAKRSGRRFKGLKFRNVAFRLNGDRGEVERLPTIQQLLNWQQRLSGQDRIWVLLYPPASKTDPDGSIFGTKAIPFLYTGEDSAAAAIRDLAIDALRDGLSGEAYADRALFADDQGQPLEASHMDDALRDALRIFLTEDVAKQYSWHCHRIRLACKLRAAHKDDHTIQACVRWRSARALDIYARFEPQFYWNLLMDASRCDPSSVEISSLPEIDESRRLQCLRSTTLAQLLQPELELPADRRQVAEDQRQRIATPRSGPTGAEASSSQQCGEDSSTRPASARPAATKELPPGFRLEVRNAKARDYKLYVAPDGRKLPSLKKAWLHHEQRRSQPNSSPVLPSSFVPRTDGAEVPGANGERFLFPPLYRMLPASRGGATSGPGTQSTSHPTRSGLALGRGEPVLPGGRRPSMLAPAASSSRQPGETQRAASALTRVCGTPGCTLADFHEGPCSVHARVGRPPPERVPAIAAARAGKGHGRTQRTLPGPALPQNFAEEGRQRGART